MVINDQVFNEFKESKKWKELFDFKSLETNVALVFALISIPLFNLILNTATIDDINNIARALSKDIGIAILGLLGFLITGLAILLSSVTPNVVSNLEKIKKDNLLYRIFLGFYFEGLLIGFTILLLFTSYLITYVHLPINSNLFLTITFISIYLVVFILFYSISLIGNCISIFRLVNKFNDLKIDTNSNMISPEDKSLFNEIKLIVLEQLLILENSNLNHKDKLIKYITLFEEYIIKFSNDDEQKQRLLNYFYTIYKNNLNN